MSQTILIVEGEMFSVEAAVLNSKSPATMFLESLAEKEQVKLGVLFKKLADTGKIKANWLKGDGNA